MTTTDYEMCTIHTLHLSRPVWLPVNKIAREHIAYTCTTNAVVEERNTIAVRDFAKSHTAQREIVNQGIPEAKSLTHTPTRSYALNIIVDPN